MAEVKRKKGETFEAFLRRFNKKLQQSGKILQSKKIRFYDRGKSKNLTRASALRRLAISEKREYLKKVGKLKEDSPADRYKSRR